MTPLMFGAATGQGDVVKALVLSRADPGVFNVEGKGILQLARQTSNTRMYPWLLMHATTKDGRSLIDTDIKTPKKESTNRGNFSKNYRHPANGYILRT